MRIARAPGALKAARENLRDRVYAHSTKGPRKQRLKVVKRLCRAMGTKYLPIEPRAAEGVMAALVESQHRTAPSYLLTWRKEHVTRGHAWTEQLATQQADLNRAAKRGLGPSK